VAPEPLQRQNLVPDNDDALSNNNAADVLVGAIKSALSPEIKAQAARIADRLSFEVSCLNGTLQSLYQGYAHIDQCLYLKKMLKTYYFSLCYCAQDGIGEALRILKERVLTRNKT
jgi:hypothetical protein